MSEQPKVRVEQLVRDIIAKPLPLPRRAPKNWPPQLVCPQCATVQPTEQFFFPARHGAGAHLLNRVVICMRPGCGHIFSPTPKYLERVARAIQALALTEQGDLVPKRATRRKRGRRGRKGRPTDGSARLSGDFSQASSVTTTA
jgi:hypothetical protein